MRVELAFVSFLSSALLIVSILFSRPVRTNFLHVCLISWLFLCNVVHGVNSLIWAGSTEIHVPVWCDIVTKLLFGFYIALPAVGVCIARHLELISSSRKVADDSVHQRARFMINVALCITIPLVFTSLHVIVQDHRFDLTADYGCSPSTHSSLLALSITWIPVLIMCIIAFVFSGFILYNLHTLRPTKLKWHLNSRGSALTPSRFMRLYVFVLLSTTASLAFVVASALSEPLEDWVSWTNVHRGFYEVNVVAQSSGAIEASWWLPVVITFLYLSLAIVPELLSGLSSGCLGSPFRKWWPRNPAFLPTHTMQIGRNVTSTPVSSTAGSCSLPINVELVSGWDGMLNSKKPTRSASPKHPRLVIEPSHDPAPPLSRCSLSPPSRPASSTPHSPDDIFMASTLDYLTSPVARSLGLNSPARPEPPLPAPIVMVPEECHLKKPEPVDLEGAESTIDSIYNVPWPLPPSTLPYPVRSTPLERPSSHQSSSSRDSFGFQLYPTEVSSATPPTSRPFEGSMSPIPSKSKTRVPGSSTAAQASLRIPSVKRQWSKERLGARHSPSASFVYMTVVQETT